MDFRKPVKWHDLKCYRFLEELARMHNKSFYAIPEEYKIGAKNYGSYDRAFWDSSWWRGETEEVLLRAFWMENWEEYWTNSVLADQDGSCEWKNDACDQHYINGLISEGFRYLFIQDPMIELHKR